jgi:hypothetical protein
VTRKQRVTRVVYGVYVVVVAAFVVSNIVQVAGAVFSERGTSPSTDSTGMPFPTVGPACAELLEKQLQAIEKARLLASSEPNGEAAKARYAKERSIPPSGELERTCAADPQGIDALAALARLDRVADAHAVRSATELSPVRLAAQSFISGHPR